MWFRDVSASMGLCLDLGAVLECHPDVILAVNCDVIDHRQPVGFTELRQRLPAPQVLQVGFDLVLPGHALGNQVGDLGVSGLGLIEPGHQSIVLFFGIHLDSKQIYFVNQIIEYIVRNGVMKDFAVMREPPFIDKGYISEVFPNMAVWAGIRRIIETINSNAAA